MPTDPCVLALPADDSPRTSMLEALIKTLMLIVLSMWGGIGLEAQRVDTVRVGNTALRDARLRTGDFAIRSFVRANGTDTPTSMTTQQIREGREGGVAIYVISTVHMSDDTTRSSIVVHASDFSLRHHRVKARRDSAAVSANAGHLTGWVALPDEPVRLIDQPLARPVFPVEGQMPWLFPLLPLREGYRAAIPHFSEWEGGEVWSTIRVTGSEAVALGGETRDCWVIDGGELFPGYRITHWVDKDTRLIVQSAARGAEGAPEYWAKAQDVGG